ncbi:dynamin family protein [uncultured Desulfosarcina sp.]|uniref:dynamin family protein n=1 Tax=uncultured Desulfosarcina sp. TaxID=218289 RepID=UPI0029C87155|nr:dynamin family protein [uncultured Desulfosarcina sp.]
MPAYETLKHQLAEISNDTARLLDDAEEITERVDEGIAHWRSTCRTISEQISQETMRVAVVGAIKSGKSTFVNTLFGGDYLKRGAGVVTSIVTRVRIGPELRAILYLKSWDEVNREIDQASVLLPSNSQPAETQPFDIRREKDRQRLTAALDDLAADQLISNDTRSAGSVLLECCLNGYERVRELVEADQRTVIFENGRFPEHRDFVGDDALAVYLKDVQLEIDTSGLGEGVEIADCQGSDSPNPLHLAMIQDYLMMAHLTLYVVSSRTGLRQADIRFLSMIRKMGIMDTVAFIVNCDFSEHESLEDLVEGVRKIEADLSLLCPEPELFTFSALFRLMSQMEADLSPRDRDRYAHWCREAEMVAFADRERSRFAEFLEQKIRREKSHLLLKNHLERLEIVAGGIGSWIAFNRDLLARDVDGARELADHAHRQQDRLDRLKQTVKNALDGALIQAKRDLKSAVDGFFKEHDGGVVDGVVQFVRGYRVEMERYDENLKAAGFAKTLYRVFQEFKQAVDAHMAETVNPMVIRFIRSREKSLAEYLDEIAEPYGAMIDEALKPVTAAVTDEKNDRRLTRSAIRIGPELDAIRKMAGLSLPPAAATMRYSAQIKTEAVMRFGFYKVVNLVKKALKKTGDKAHGEQFLALASGIRRMKRETERSILFHMKDYRENIKYQYMLKLADAAASALYSQVQERFRHHGADLSRLVDLMGEERLDKEKVSASLAKMGEASRALQDKITNLRSDLEQLNG